MTKKTTLIAATIAMLVTGSALQAETVDTRIGKLESTDPPTWLGAGRGIQHPVSSI